MNQDEINAKDVAQKYESNIKYFMSSYELGSLSRKMRTKKSRGSFRIEKQYNLNELSGQIKKQYGANRKSLVNLK